jgi:TRAP-type C4-dicarboxylate transport system permease large subunit
VIRPLIPLLGVEVVVLILVTYIPWLTLFLPRLFGFVK